MGLLGQSVLVSCIPECHSMPRFVIQRQSYGLGFGAFADAGKLDTLGGASSEPQQYLFKTPSFTTCIKQQRQNKIKQGFLAILNDQRWLLNTGLETYANMTGFTAPRRQTFAQHLPTLLPSHPKLRQTKQIQRLKSTHGGCPPQAL